MKEKVIRVLNIVPNMRAAGIESFIMNVYRNIDREKIQFDFLVHSKKREFFDDEIEKLGGKIYRLSLKDDKNIFKYIFDLNNFFKIHSEYKIIHGHMQSMMPIYLFLASKNSIPIRIAHSHNGSFEKTFKGFILHLFSRFSKKFSTINYACSDVAGKYLFGKNEYKIIYNGIDTKKFQADSNKRKKIRNALKIEHKYVIGHIGRFELQKNHEFIIEMFKEIQKIRPDAHLLLIGEGKLEEKIKNKVKLYEIEDKVSFLGVRNDIDEVYQGMDCFILPSLYEGLPVVGIEAQIAGLKCVFSNTITDEVKITNNTYFKELNIETWKDIILQSVEESEAKIDFEKFEIKKIATEMQKYYEDKNEELTRKEL